MIQPKEILMNLISRNFYYHDYILKVGITIRDITENED